MKSNEKRALITITRDYKVEQRRKRKEQNE